MVLKRKGEIDIIKLIEILDDKHKTYSTFFQIINILKQNDQLNNLILKKILSIVIEKTLTIDESANIIRNLNSTIINKDDLSDIISFFKDKIELTIDYNKITEILSRDNQPFPFPFEIKKERKGKKK